MTTLPAFVLAVLLISASPGPAMALIMRRAARHGFQAAVPTVLGLEAGIYLWALAAGAGFAALVAASEVAFTVLRVVGAAVLLFLGGRALYAAWRQRGAGEEAPTDAGDEPRPRGASARAFGEGLIVMLANPKAAIFMMAFYPQFIPADQPLFVTTAVFGAVQVVVETAFYLGLAALIGRARSWFSRPAIRRRLDAISGTVLVTLGARVAASGR